MSVYQIKKVADEFEISGSAAIKMRIRYLHQILMENYHYWNDEKEPMPQVMFDEALDELIELHRALRAFDKKQSKDAITEEMVAQARTVPIESIVSFTNGKARAWCHDDSNPSLSLWKGHNMATCFVCDLKFNPIDVLMSRDSKSFIEAVRTLLCLT